jgi:ABC-type polar amino acid transport system ATPase subunit
MSLVKCHNLGRFINNYWLYRDVSLSLGAGVVTALIGPSGSGKTSLLRSIALLDTPTLGELEHSQELLDTGGEYYPSISFVAQDFPLWPHVSIGRMRSLVQIDGAADYFTTLGVSSLLERQPHQMSAGQRQRAALALALSTRPRVLILDEITSAQDVENAALIAETLKELKNQGLSIFASTHFLQFAANIADTFIFMDKGQMIEEGLISGLGTPRTQRLRDFMFLKSDSSDVKKSSVHDNR